MRSQERKPLGGRLGRCPGRAAGSGGKSPILWGLGRRKVRGFEKMGKFLTSSFNFLKCELKPSAMNMEAGFGRVEKLAGDAKLFGRIEAGTRWRKPVGVESETLGTYLQSVIMHWGQVDSGCDVPLIAGRRWAVGLARMREADTREWNGIKASLGRK